MVTGDVIDLHSQVKLIDFGALCLVPAVLGMCLELGDGCGQLWVAGWP